MGEALPFESAIEVFVSTNQKKLSCGWIKLVCQKEKLVHAIKLEYAYARKVTFLFLAEVRILNDGFNRNIDSIFLVSAQLLIGTSKDIRLQNLNFFSHGIAPA